MRMNTKGHMVFNSDREAMNYASNAGFRVTVETGTGKTVATREDMDSEFTLQKLSKGKHFDWMWYRPYSEINYG